MKYSEIKFILQQLKVYGWQRARYPKSMKEYKIYEYYNTFQNRQYQYRLSIPLHSLISMAKMHGLDFIPLFLRNEANRAWSKIEERFLEDQKEDYERFLLGMEREPDGETERKS